MSHDLDTVAPEIYPKVCQFGDCLEPVYAAVRVTIQTYSGFGSLITNNKSVGFCKNHRHNAYEAGALHQLVKAMYEAYE